MTTADGNDKRLAAVDSASGRILDEAQRSALLSWECDSAPTR